MQKLNRFIVISAAISVASSAIAEVTQTTVSFQPGVDGYSSLVERLISSTSASQLPSAANPTPGNWFVDGGGTASSPDQQALLRWENIIGSGAGRIPVGATVLRAKLTLTTGSATDSGNAQTGGWFGVTRLTGKQILTLGGPLVTQQFDANTTYGNFDVSGPNFGNGNGVFVDRPVGSFVDPIDAAAGDGDSVIDQDQVVSASVGPMVQKWVNNPSSNFGLAVQAGNPASTTDGWMFGTQWNADVARRPKLEVTYTTDAVETVSFQRGVNGYDGAVSAWVKADNNVANPFDGSQLNQQFLDGPAANSPDDQGLFRFNNIFSDEGGSIDRDAEIIDAQFVLTTGNSSTNSPSRGSFDVAGVTRDWDVDITNADKPSLYSEWSNGFGPSSDDPDNNGQTDLTPTIVRFSGMVDSQVMSADITDLFKQWQNGTMANYGLNVQAYNTADGWQVNFDNASDLSARPQLLVRVLVPTGNWAADANGNWTDTANWLNAKVPNGKGHVANFGSVITAPRTVTIDANKTAGVIRFDSAQAYTLAGTGTITLNRSAANDVSIEVLQGSHVISAPLVLAHSTTFDVAAVSSLSVTGSLSATGVNVTKAGSGTVNLPGVRSAGLTVAGGRLVMTQANTDASASLVSSLTVATGATLDLNDNALLIDYATGGTSPLAGLAASIADGRVVSTNALTNSNYAIGTNEASSLVGTTIFAGITLDADMVVADLTLKGDTDLNYTVSFDDLLSLAQNYDAVATGKTWANGDSNYDGLVNFDDLLALAQNYGGNALDAAGLLTSSGIDGQFISDWALARSLTPEPASMVAMGALAVTLRRRR